MLRGSTFPYKVISYFLKHSFSSQEHQMELVYSSNIFVPILSNFSALVQVTFPTFCFSFHCHTFCICMQSTDSSLSQNKDLTNVTFPCYSVLSALSHPEIAFNFLNLGYSTSIDHFFFNKILCSFDNCHF